MNASERTLEAVVIGGGLAGLAIGYELKELGLDCLILEAAPRAGGVIRSEQVKGFLVESAAHGFLDKEPSTRALIARLGLKPELLPADAAVERRRYLFTRGALRLAPSTPPQFLASDLLPLAARLRVLAELWLPRRTRSALSEESVAAFARRRLGARAAAVLVDAMQSGIYAGDPERLSLEACFPQLSALERTHRSLILGLFRTGGRRALPPTSGEEPLSRRMTSFRGGMETLVRSLSAALGESLRCDSRVAHIDREGHDWRVALDAGQTLRSKTLILAIPAPAAAVLAASLSPPLARELQGIRYAPLSVVHLGFPAKTVPVRPRGFGFLVPFEEGLGTLGTFFVDQFFPGRAPDGSVLLTSMVGGMRRADAALENPIGAALGDLGRILGLRATPTFTHGVTWPQAIPQYELGHLARLARIDAERSAFPGLFLAGNAYRGVGVNDCIRDAVAVATQVVRTVRT